MDALASTLSRSPELFPHSLDLRNDTVALVRLTRADYEKASFLDERVLGSHSLSRTLPFATLEAGVTAAQLQERCHFIFHIGHVGSTLLSRLLGADRRIFALREPSILRNLVQMKSDPEQQPRVWTEQIFEPREAIFLKLWSRTFAPEQASVIKATSYVSELAAALLARPSRPRAILLTVKPQSYIATILAGQNARVEARGLTAGRLKRLHKRIGREIWRLGSFGEGEALALAWACEMCGLVEAARAAGERALFFDFDAFLGEPQTTLTAAFRHLECDVTDREVGAILAGPLMTRYSKAQEHEYSPALRRELLDEANKTHGAEIAKGLSWLERAARDVPEIAAILQVGAVG